MKLSLGVDDVPYVDPADTMPALVRKAAEKKYGKRKVNRFLNKLKRGIGLAGVQTTGDVAAILESKYGIMTVFSQMNGQFIADEMAKSVAGAFETISQGGPPVNPFASAKQAIETRFRQALSQREFDGKIPGVPTAASLAGVTHRRKHPYAQKNPERPSFIDTGLFQATMRATFEE